MGLERTNLAADPFSGLPRFLDPDASLYQLLAEHYDAHIDTAEQLHTGLQWSSCPRESGFGCGMTCWRGLLPRWVGRWRTGWGVGEDDAVNAVVVDNPQAQVVLELLRSEIEKETARGATVRVLHRGEIVVDLACGYGDGERPLSVEDDVPWFSASKIASSIAVARAWELGLLDLDTPVATYLPDFGRGGKDSITPRQLWTHTAPLQTVDRAINTAMTWSEALERICAAEVDAVDRTGGTAYLGHVGMLVLGELVTRRSRTAFADFFAAEIAEPLALRSRLGAPQDGAELVDVPFLGTPPTSVRFNADAQFPSNCITGPFGEAAVLCQLLRDGGVYRGHAVLQSKTAAAITALQASTAMDRRLGMPVASGLGVEIDSFPFGRHCSPRSFGHGGARSCVAFADPEADLAVAVFFNGNCPLREHIRRISAVSTAVYLDIGLASSSDPGRDHRAPLGIVV